MPLRKVCVCEQVDCISECKEDEFLCRNRAHCVPARWRCDRVFDCLDQSDEDNCDQGNAPKSDTGWCMSGSQDALHGIKNVNVELKCYLLYF